MRHFQILKPKKSENIMKLFFPIRRITHFFMRISMVKIVFRKKKFSPKVPDLSQKIPIETFVNICCKIFDWLNEIFEKPPSTKPNDLAEAVDAS